MPALNKTGKKAVTRSKKTRDYILKTRIFGLLAEKPLTITELFDELQTPYETRAFKSGDKDLQRLKLKEMLDSMDLHVCSYGGRKVYSAK